MYQFMGQDKMFDGTGHMVWVGVMTPPLPYVKGKLGLNITMVPNTGSHL